MYIYMYPYIVIYYMIIIYYEYHKGPKNYFTIFVAKLFVK